MLDGGGQARAGLGGGWSRATLGAVDDAHLGDELVALAVHRADHPLQAPVVADHLAHRLDLRRQRRLADEAVAPDAVEQLLLAHHLAAPLHEVAEEIERLRLDADLVAVAA